MMSRSILNAASHTSWNTNAAVFVRGSRRLARWSFLNAGVVCAALLPAHVYGIGGSLDPTFGQGGIAAGNTAGRYNAIALQKNGSIVVAGSVVSNGFLVSRFTPQGARDASFGSGGSVVTAVGPNFDTAQSVVIQSDGKIVAVGYSHRSSTIFTNADLAVVRYNSDGTLDGTFGNGGKVTTAISNTSSQDTAAGNDEAFGAVLQLDGKLVVVGETSISSDSTKIVVVRYNGNGTLDTSFGTGGKVLTQVRQYTGASSVALQPDGKILVAGYTTVVNASLVGAVVVRYTSNGTLDSTFGTNGIAKLPELSDNFAGAGAVALQADGRIVLAGGWNVPSGSTHRPFGVARLNPNGTLDSTFNKSGTASVYTDLDGLSKDNAGGVAVQPDGRIVVAGGSTGTDDGAVALARFNADGTLDTTFNRTGRVRTVLSTRTNASANCVTVQSGSKILTAGVYYAGTVIPAVLQYDGSSVPVPPEAAPLPAVNAPPGSIVNLSTRLGVQTGDDVLIGGFIVQGVSQKSVAVRGIGPSLAASGVAGALSDPTLELHNGNGALIDQNDDWRSGNAQAIINSGLAPTDDHEAAIITLLPPGAYTAVVRGANNSTGVGLVEVYDLASADNSRAVNISTRGAVGRGDNVMIAGFIVQSHTRKVVVRGLGPSLSSAGVAGVLADPVITIYSGAQAIATNDNWVDDGNNSNLQAYGLAPQSAREAAVIADLAPGPYTAILSGASGTTGVGLVEVYDVSRNPTAISHATIRDAGSPLADLVVSDATGEGMAVRGSKTVDGLVTHVDDVILFNSKTNGSSVVRFDANGFVASINSSTGLRVEFSAYNWATNTVSVLYLDNQRNVILGPATIPIDPQLRQLGVFVTSGQFPATAAGAGQMRAESTAVTKTFWETRIGSLIAGTITAVVSAKDILKAPSFPELAWSGIEMAFSLNDVKRGATDSDISVNFHDLSPLVDGGACLLGLGALGEGVGAFAFAATAIACNRTYNHFTGTEQSQLDVPSYGVLQFTAREQQASEGDGTTTLWIERINGSSGAVSATVSLANPTGTAQFGYDFVYFSQTVTFSDGETGPKPVSVALVDDDIVEPPGRYVDFELTGLTGGAQVGDPNTCRLDIRDDDEGWLNVTGSELVIEYTWPAGQKDLDTGTTFLGHTVGFQYASSALYMHWTGDDTSASGTEIVTIDIEKAAQDGVLPASFTIDAKAGWYAPAGGSGPASLTVYVRKKMDPSNPYYKTSRRISPGTQSGQATTFVGHVVFTQAPAVPGLYKWTWH